MKIVDHPEIIVTGISVNAPLQQLSIEAPKDWCELFNCMPQFDGLENLRFMDINLEVNDSVYLQLVGAKFLPDINLPSCFRTVCIPARKLLHNSHVCPVSGIFSTFSSMYRHAKEQNTM